MRPARTPHPPEVLQAFVEALGGAHVVTAPPALAEAERATFATSQRIWAILRPGSADEVRACLRIATRHGVPLHPVSAGRNWGYGSRVPPSDGCALLELSRMGRILELDERLGTLTVEPGATFAKAHAQLEATRSKWMLAAIGGPPEASLLANALERGDGTGPHGDAFAHVCGLEVMLPTGECLRTGHARYDGARSARAFRWGVGPVLDGLFSQSNFGVVTQLTFQLARRPEAFGDLFACVDSHEALAPLVDAVRELRCEGTLRGACSFWNDYKAFSKLQRYPFEATSGATPLPEWAYRQMRALFFGGKWSFTAAIYAATEAQQRAARERIEQVLAKVTSQLHFRAGLEAQDSPLLGRPSTGNLAMAYWRKRGPVPSSPHLDADGCGFLWHTCAVPLLGERALEAATLAEAVPPRFGFEPNVSLLGISDRCAYLVTLLVYDREVAGEDEKARACHAALLSALCEAGYPLARSGIQATTGVTPNDDSEAVLRRLKRALDPEGILSPGRYGLF